MAANATPAPQAATIARPRSVPDRQAASTRERPQPSPARPMPSARWNVASRCGGRGGEPPAVGVGPLRIADAEQLAQRGEHLGDRAVGLGVVRAGDVGRGVRDQHRGAVAAAVTVVGDEGEHRVAVDEGGRERRPRALGPARGHGDHRAPPAVDQLRGDGVEQAGGLRVRHGEHDGVGGLAVDARAGADVAHLVLQCDVQPGGERGDQAAQTVGGGPPHRAGRRTRGCRSRRRRGSPSRAGPARPPASARRPARTPGRRR